MTEETRRHLKSGDCSVVPRRYIDIGNSPRVDIFNISCRDPPLRDEPHCAPEHVVSLSVSAAVSADAHRSPQSHSHRLYKWPGSGYRPGPCNCIDLWPLRPDSARYSSVVRSPLRRCHFPCHSCNTIRSFRHELLFTRVEECLRFN